MARRRVTADERAYRVFSMPQSSFHARQQAGVPVEGAAAGIGGVAAALGDELERGHHGVESLLVLAVAAGIVGRRGHLGGQGRPSEVDEVGRDELVVLQVFDGQRRVPGHGDGLATELAVHVLDRCR
ncbi:MAG: hypothetical protein ACRD0S_05735 [Acidimicrobiales bacterium]